jgi:hypothetical protein
LGGVTSVVGDLRILGNGILANVNGLSALTSVDGYLGIMNNVTLANLDGLSNLTSVVGAFYDYGNSAQPDCEVCELLDQLTAAPASIDVHDNLADTCTPVPASCP